MDGEPALDVAAHVYPHVGRLRTVLEFGVPTHVGGMRGSLDRLRMCVPPRDYAWESGSLAVSDIAIRHVKHTM